MNLNNMTQISEFADELIINILAGEFLGSPALTEDEFDSKFSGALNIMSYILTDYKNKYGLKDIEKLYPIYLEARKNNYSDTA